MGVLKKRIRRGLLVLITGMVFLAACQKEEKEEPSKEEASLEVQNEDGEEPKGDKAEEEPAQQSSLPEEEISEGEMYQEYAKKILSYEEMYGPAMVNQQSEWFSYMTGLCFMKLVDFAHDGKDELLLAYQTNEATEGGMVPNYKFEVWGFQNNELAMLDSGELFGANGGVKIIYLTEAEGATYLVTGAQDSFGCYYYHGYQGDEFSVVREVRQEENIEGGEPFCYIDGEPVSQETLMQEQSKWMANVTEYNLNMDSSGVMEQNQETKRRLSLDYETESEPENQEMDEEEIYSKLVAHYENGTEDSPGDDLAVQEGGFYEDGKYHTDVRCGVPGNPSASQRLYEIVVDALTGEVTQTNVLVGGEMVRFNLNYN